MSSSKQMRGTIRLAPIAGALVLTGMLAGCLAMKVLTGGFDVLDSKKVLAVKVGESTRADVERLLGPPQKRKDAEHVYLYIDIRAKPTEKYIQEAHYFFDDQDVVTRTTFVDIIKYAEYSNPLAIEGRLSALKIGESKITDVLMAPKPTALYRIYKDSALWRKGVRYLTKQPMSGALAELPHVGALEHSNGNASYSLFFDEFGVLLSKEAGEDEELDDPMRPKTAK